MSEYQAFLVRFHRYSERTNWQVTLENIHTHEVQHFASIDEALRSLKYRAIQLDDVGDSRLDVHSNAVSNLPDSAS